MARRYNTRRVKKNLAYSVEELADATGVTQATVRNWIKAGMQVLDQQRPLFVIGFQAQDYLGIRIASTKRPLAKGEFIVTTASRLGCPMGDWLTMNLLVPLVAV